MSSRSFRNVGKRKGGRKGGRQRQFGRRTNLGADRHLEDFRMPPGATLSIHELEAHMAKLIDPATGQFPTVGVLEMVLSLWQISRRAYKSSMNSKSR